MAAPLDRDLQAAANLGLARSTARIPNHAPDLRARLTAHRGRSRLQKTLRALIETEQADGEIDLLDDELAKLPAEQQLIANETRQAEQAVVDARSVLEREELEERRLESQMRDQEELLLRLNHQSAQVSSNQAYTALQHELDAAEAAKTNFETLALEHMEAIDRAKEALSVAEEKQVVAAAIAPKKAHEIDLRRKQGEAKRAEVVALREKACAGIDVKIMKRYQSIRKKKQPAIAVLHEKSCPQCRIGLPRVRVSEILRAEELFECTNCKRLLAPAKIFDAGS